MKRQTYFLALLFLGTWLGAGTAPAASAGTVVAWGYNDYGQTTVPVAAQSGVTAIAAGGYHTVVLLGGVPLLPCLNATSTGNELLLSWSTNAVGFTLQSTLDLTPSVVWVDAANPPSVVGTQFTVTNSLSGSAQFYRLRQP